MRGSMNYQVNQVAMKSGIFQPGTSRHHDKNAVRDSIAETGARATAHEIASQTGIYSYGTFECYKDVWHAFGRFCRSEMNLKDMLKVGTEHVHEFLEYRAVVDQISWSTFKLESAALNKLDDALIRFCARQGIDDVGYDFSKVISEAKAEFKDILDRPAQLTNRAYENPDTVCSKIESPAHRLAWQLAVEGGGRISEITYIKESQLRGIQKDGQTRKEVGVIEIKGKGGLKRPLLVTPSTYQKLEKALANKDGLFAVRHDGLRASVRHAAGGEYKGRGVHGARYCFAQDRYLELTRHGYTHEQTLHLVSEALGHHRADITMHYLCM